MKKIYILVFLLILGFTGCDVIDPPYTQGGDIDVDTTKKKVLIEDFTGFRCGNCPEAGEVAHEIAVEYKGQVIQMAIHAGALAIPTPQRTYEFRTPVGNDIASYFNLPATPYGMVNRTAFGGNALLAPNTWASAVVNEASKLADVKITLSGNYNSASNTIILDAQLKFIKAGTADMYLAAYIVEDSIVQYQRDDRLPDVHVLNYVHNHVLRGSMNGTWGEQISEFVIPAGTILSKNIQYKIPDGKDWVPKNLSIIAVVQNNTTKEILQVEKLKL